MANEPTKLQRAAIRYYAGLPAEPDTESLRITGRTIGACVRRGWLTEHHDAPRLRTTDRARNLVRIVDDPCWVCGGGNRPAPCRHGRCTACGGHSEHNFGCRTLAST